MTHDELQAMLADLPHALPAADDPGVVAALEQCANAAPANRAIRTALRAAHGLATAEAGLPALVAGVHRTRLVRWDDMSTTWVGRRPDTGLHAMVRVLRPHAARDPVLRRALERDGRAIATVLPALRIHDNAITTPLSGPTVLLSRGGQVTPSAVVRLLVTAISQVHRWKWPAWARPGPRSMSFGTAAITSRSRRSLRPPATTQDRPLAHIAHLVSAWWAGAQDHPIADLADGLATLPPRYASDAVGPTLRALADALANARHEVVSRARAERQSSRHEQLRRRIADLEAVFPPPAGRAALGVDLDGRTLVVTCDGDVLLWCPADAPEPDVVFDLDEGFDVPLARRLVRARGKAPVSAGLNAEVGGDPTYADAIVRWVAASLELRTIRMLMDAADT